MDGGDMAQLGVNVDHVATLRQARYREAVKGLTPEPDPIAAAALCEKAGAHGITVHLREDRRHIQEPDVKTLRRTVKTRLNLELAVTPGMLRHALKLKPDEACLVPESRQEVTTEGGLNVTAQRRKIREAVRQLSEAGIVVSLFIDPEPAQIEAAQAVGAPCIELHTGAYANAVGARAVARELKRHRLATDLARADGIQVNAGHGLHYTNVRRYLETLPDVHTLNIGHSILSRALFTGLDQAVRDMLQLIR
jgi:pyridoxine 5-phosphate synthase